MNSIEIVRQGDNWTYASGPTHQLDTWEPYLCLLERSGMLDGRHAFVHCTNQYPINDIDQLFPWNFWRELVRRKRGQQMIVIFDSHTEGVSWRHVSRTVNRMLFHDGIDPRCVVQWTGGSHEPDSPIQTVTVMDVFSLISWPQYCMPASPRHHFVMLARIPKPHRIAAAVAILDRGLEAHGFMSCGSGSHGTFDRKAFEHVPTQHRHRFPLLLPGDSVNHVQTVPYTIESTTRSEVTGAFCSVIPETSHDLMAPNVCTAFMTEKSEKCFLLEQVPIWIAASGQAALAREWGFDVFDDIIDHGYDLEPDPYKRTEMAADQLALLCAQPISKWQQYKLDNQERFMRNRTLCMELRATHPELQYRKLVDCIARMPAVG